MKILQIIYSLGSGGAERFVVDLSNELAENGHDIYLCILLDDSRNNQGFYLSELNNKVNFTSLKLPPKFKISNIFVLFRLIKKINPEIIHSHHNLINYLFPLTLIFTKIKFFHTIHSDPPREVSNLLEFWLRKLFYSTGKVKAVTISNETSKSFLNYYKTIKFTEIFNGRSQPVSTHEFKSVSEYFNKMRQTYSNIFIHVGRCAPVKNQEMLIKVFNRLFLEGNSIALIIIGDGFDNQRGIELRAIATENIYILNSRHNIIDYYLNSDAFCLSSTHEGMPITLIESLACGCVPICTPVGGITDVIEDGVTGFLSRSIQEDDYYQSINTFLNSRNLIKKDNLINKYNEVFSIEKCTRKYLEIYQNA